MPQKDAISRVPNIGKAISFVHPHMGANGAIRACPSGEDEESPPQASVGCGSIEFHVGRISESDMQIVEMGEFWFGRSCFYGARTSQLVVYVSHC
jgi:hypothetical protein